MESMDHKKMQAIMDAAETTKLLNMLKGVNDTLLQQAAEAAKRGDYSHVQKLLSPILGKNAEKLATDLGNRIG